MSVNGGLRHDLPKALRIVWLILGTVSGLLVLAPFFLPAQTLFSVFPVCAAKAAGSSCFLCGMTTAFVSIGRSDWAGALAANSGAIPLYIGLIVNFVAATAYTMMRVKRHANP